jgi:hypothetical protein
MELNHSCCCCQFWLKVQMTDTMSYAARCNALLSM